MISYNPIIDNYVYIYIYVYDIVQSISITHDIIQLIIHYIPYNIIFSGFLISHHNSCVIPSASGDPLSCNPVIRACGRAETTLGPLRKIRIAVLGRRFGESRHGPNGRLGESVFGENDLSKFGGQWKTPTLSENRYVRDLMFEQLVKKIQ